jgi:hypothetical protein
MAASYSERDRPAVASYGEEAEWTSRQQPAEYYRAAAARARSLERDATTARIKQHLRELIDRYERLAGEIERTSERDMPGKFGDLA